MKEEIVKLLLGTTKEKPRHKKNLLSPEIDTAVGPTIEYAQPKGRDRPKGREFQQKDNICIGTTNPAKLKEMKEIFGERFETVELASFKNVPEVEETGKTFEENALLKAKAYYNFSGIPTVADDGGLEIDALGGEPGIKSRRWPSFAEVSSDAKALEDKSEGKPGREKTDRELIEMTFEKLRGVPWEKRTAKLRVSAVFYNGDFGITIDSKVEGYIIEEKPVQCDPGYPFRPIFWVPRFNKVYQDLTPQERDQLPHRRTIYRKLRNIILKLAP